MKNLFPINAKINILALLLILSSFAFTYSQGIPIDQLKPELSKFFNDTSITKLKSIFDPKTKQFKAKGYKANWELYHMHHVCISGGKDGVYVGTTEEINDWPSKIAGGVSMSVWNKEGGRGSLDVVKLNYSSIGVVTKHTLVKGPSLLIACHRQLPDLLYPAMWASKLGTIFELAKLYKNASDPGFNASFNEPVPGSFDNMIMHQCADPAVTNWEWGKAVLAITLAQAIESKMFRSGDSSSPTVISGYFYNERVEELVCFEDIYLSLRSNIWIQGPDDITSFRKRAADLTGEPAEALKSPEKFPEIMAPTSTQPYCTKDETKTNAKIKIYQRSAGRKFTNLDEVKALVQKYSSVPVEVVTASPNTTVADLIRLFNNFDILVSPEGGHLTSGIFTMNPGSKAVVEVSSAVYELLYYKNYQLRLGFLTYILSDGHFTPDPNCPWHSVTDFERDCVLDSKAIVGKIPQSYYKCKIKNRKDLNIFRMCDTTINIEKLTKAMDQLYAVTCPPLVAGAATGLGGSSSTSPPPPSSNSSSSNLPVASTPVAIAKNNSSSNTTSSSTEAPPPPPAASVTPSSNNNNNNTNTSSA